jgi:uncharacterized protein (TIGR02246 family)
MSEDEKAIRALVAAWMDATLRGDIDGVLAMMTDDVVFLVPGLDPFGKAEFAVAAREAQGAVMTGRSTVQEVQVAGDWAFLRTRLAVAVTPPGSPETIRQEGHALTILRRERGRWRVARDANLLVRID